MGEHGSEQCPGSGERFSRLRLRLVWVWDWRVEVPSRTLRSFSSMSRETGYVAEMSNDARVMETERRDQDWRWPWLADEGEWLMDTDVEMGGKRWSLLVLPAGRASFVVWWWNAGRREDPDPETETGGVRDAEPEPDGDAGQGSELKDGAAEIEVGLGVRVMRSVALADVDVVAIGARGTSGAMVDMAAGRKGWEGGGQE